ncbi:MAG: hypothetical protein AAB669_02400 [Patescibacteria group bacterium]
MSRIKMGLAVLLLIVVTIVMGVVGCGGGGAAGSFSYGQKYTGTAGDGTSSHYSDFYIQLDGEGNIVSAKSYSGQGPRCSIAGSVRKTGNFLDITVVLTVPVNNASCSNIVMSASGQLAYNRETKWWEGLGTGTFSDAPNSTVQIGFSLAQDDEWD